jgi:acyl carrier protein
VTNAARIRQFVEETFIVDGFADEDSFLRTGVIDSTGMMELVLFLELEYGIKIADSELVPGNLDSIARAAAFVDRKRAGTATVAS